MNRSIHRPLVHLGAVAFAAAVVVLAGATPGSAAPAQRSAAPMTSVYVVQGVPDSTVEVTVDGKSVRSNLAAKGIVGPLSLAAGAHDIAFTSPDWSVTSAFETRGGSLDVVVHWPADKADRPDVTVFENDLRPVANGKGRLTVAHTAVVPPADIRVDSNVLFSNIANGEFVTANVPADSYAVDIVPTGVSVNPLFGPVSLPVADGTLTRVFAIGQPTDNSMAAVVQTIDLRQTGSPAPDRVTAGEAGLAATTPDQSAGPGVAISLGIVLVGSAGVLLSTRRRKAVAAR